MSAPAAPQIAAIILHRDDDVAVLVRPASAGESIAVGGARSIAALPVNVSLPIGHKLALRALDAGTPVRKYGEVIGALTSGVAAGDHVHVHNLVSLRGQ